MFRHYLKIARRNLLKYKSHALINVIGLSVGIACCLLILLFVADDLSFDQFHKKKDRIYRLNKIVTPLTGRTERHAISSGLMGPAMVTEFPEVEQCVRLLPWFDDVLMQAGETRVKVPDVVIADANFFQVFDFQLLQGNPAQVLSEPMSVVLTEETARTFFGDTEPVGKTIEGLQGKLYTVTGVAAVPPENSHLRFNALISWSSTVPGVGPLNLAWLNRWITQVNFTYLLLARGSHIEELEAKFPDFMQTHMPEQAAEYTLYLQPLSDIHLHSADLRFSGPLRLGSITYVYLFGVVAVLILLIACINFVNLSTARATKRAKEIGVRKVLGALRRQLARQFLVESVVLAFLALLAAMTLVELCLPAFESFTERAIVFQPLQSPVLFMGLLGGTLLLGLLSGLYPALMLSGFRPVQTLRGWHAGGGATARRILVTLQFAASIALIAGTLIVYQQMHFVRTRNLGFEKEQIIVLPIGNTAISKRAGAFKNELLRYPAIKHVAGSNSVPGGSMMSFGVRPEGKPEDERWTAATIRVDDYDFVETYGMQMAKGRYFSAEFATDASHGVVINEALARSLGWKDAIGKRLDIVGELEEGRVIGVVKDFNMRSLHHPIDPVALQFAPRWENLSVRLSGKNIPATLAFLRRTWEAFDAKYPFDYYFLDQRFAQFYKSEHRLLQTFGLFACLAILISCLGLLGLAAFTAEQRTKEIGIRKVLGASVAGAAAELSLGFFKLLLLANLIAWPVAWHLLHKWLQDFTYRIDISWWVFVLAGGLAALIALLTVSTQAIKAALANPVESLRYE